MITDYLKKFYIKAEKMYEKLTDNDFARAKNLSAWRKKIVNSWEELQIIEVEAPDKEVIYAGEEVVVRTRIKLPQAITPNDIIVEAYYGNLDQQETIIDPRRQQMVLESQEGDVVVFKAMIPCRRGGRYGYTTRILLGNEDLAENLVPGFIKWAP
jgi:starch phosphorylase